VVDHRDLARLHPLQEVLGATVDADASDHLVELVLA
jgi:hypothetical protein